MIRAEILEKAKKCVCGDREEDYGKPEDNFKTIAELWTTYLQMKRSDIITSKDVASMMILLKVAREMANAKEDNWIDIAGYAACAAEIEFGERTV